jgi:excisionase family DNA binding protein
MTATVAEIPTAKQYAVFTVEEVSKIFRISPRTVRDLIRRGDLPAIRFGQTYRVPQAVIDQYFDLPALSHLAPGDIGFGLWAEDDSVGDAVAYVNQLRASDQRTLREVVEELSSWTE